MAGMLDGKAVIVTGGASGIGRAACLLFAREGAAVLVADVQADKIHAVATEIATSGGRALALKVDVTDAAACDAMVSAAVDSFGRLDGAFNNAGVTGRLGPPISLADYPEDAARRIFEINQIGVWNCMRAELRHMAAAGGGAIVNTSSIAGAAGSPGMAPYAASKHAVNGLTRTAAMEYAGRNIRVNSVLPGAIDTPMNSDIFPAGWQAGAARSQPMKRIGRPEEVAEAACWLLSDRASFVTAQTLLVDGGWSEAFNGS